MLYFQKFLLGKFTGFALEKANLRLQAFVLMLVYFLLSASSALEGANIVTGKVVDSATGSQLVGASVTLLKNGSIVGSTVTNSSGVYSFSSVASGTYNVTATFLGYQTTTNSVKTTGNKTFTVNFSLSFILSNITGQVTDSKTHLPIVGATISAIQNNLTILSTTTDSGGNYKLGSLNPGIYTVQVTASHYQKGTSTITTLVGQTLQLPFALISNAGSVSGQITDAVTGQAVASATVNLSQNGSLVTSATTDSRGAYTLSGLVPGSYVLQVSATHYQSGSASVTIVSDQTATANLVLTPNAGSVSGQITDAVTGQAVASATINLSQNGSLVTSATTDSRGAYTLSGLVPGVYTLQVSASHYQSGSAGVTIVSDQTATANLTLAPNT
ncbi:MAG: carboxypeptidase regulatory-like domain-containing protein, partial [Verrucomicrobia bacterium]|nr:carboxypeptidase regulatory-like domain-containing protein [Verrucomicrobiota bacterium]